jgi:UDP:flavonoid glycosyltransferase YjiC (YdhE family)
MGVAFGDCGVTHLVRQAGFPVLHQRSAGDRGVGRGQMSAYLPFGNVERVFAVAARYYRPERLQRQLDDDLANVDEFRPDVVVIDMSPTGAIAARARGVPVVSLADTDFLSTADNAWMPWLTVPSAELLPYPSCVPALNGALARLGLSPIEHPSELLWGDVTIVPSVAELEPPEDAWPLDRLRYVGPLFWDPPGVGLGLPGGPGPNVYITVGSGAMVTGKVMQNLVDACRGQPWTVFVSAGFAFTESLRLAPNVHIGGFTGLKELLRWADVVVSHGGYSTVLATLLHGKPLVVVPFMSEQEMNGRLLVEQVGTGLLVRRSRVDARTKRITFEYRTSGVSNDATVPVIDVAEAVSAVLEEPSYAARARATSRRLSAAQRADLPRLVRWAAGEADDGPR